MSTDLDTMAARLVDDVGEVRSCVILSSDGAVLSAAPLGSAPRGTEIWERFRALGSPQRGFVAVGDELWVLFVSAGRSGLLIAEPTAAPGLLLEQLELLLSPGGPLPVAVPAESGAAMDAEGTVELAAVAPGEVAEAAEAVLEDEMSAATRGGTKRIGRGTGPDPDVDPMSLVREFAWLQDDRRQGE